MSPTRIYAHRGASAELPENTIEAFARAVEVGADVLELDVHLTADDVVVVAHDPTGARMAGVPARIATTYLSEIRCWDVGRRFEPRVQGERASAVRVTGPHRVPTLREVLEAFPDTPLNIDIKRHEARAVKATLDVLGDAHAQERTTLASFSTSVMRAARAMGHRGETALSRDESLALLVAPAVASAWIRFERRRMQPPIRIGGVELGTARFVQKCRRFGLPVDFWTTDDAAEALRLASIGAAGVMTNDPVTLVRALRSG